MQTLKKGLKSKENVFTDKKKSFINSMQSFSRGIFRNTSIQSRLIVSFLLLCTIPLGLLGYLAYSLSSNAVENKIKSYSSDLMKSTADYVDVQTARIIDINNDIVLSSYIQKDLTNVSQANSFERVQTTQSIEKYLVNMYAKNNDILCSLIVTEENERLVYSQDKLISSEDIEKIKEMLESYVKQMGSDTVSLCTNWKLPDKNTVLITRYVPNIMRGGRIGVIITLIDERYLSSGYKDIDLGEGSEVFILDKQGKIISSINQSQIGQMPYDEGFMRTVFQAASDKTAVNLDDGLVATSHMKKPDWYLVSKIPYSYLFSESNTIKNYIILFLCVCVVLSLVASFFISKSISLPLKRLMNNMEKAKKGDLTLSIEDTGKDELGEVARHFNDMLANIKHLISNVHNTAQQVIDSSDLIASSTKQNLNFSHQIALSIHQIAQGNSEQAADTIKSVNNMNLLSDDIINVSDYMVKASITLKKAKEVNYKIQEEVYQLNEKAQQTSEASENIADVIHDLYNDIEKIENIINLILVVSEQTNLLSLNAAIEAARAGEAGRGFAVVAEEVKKLADQTKEASSTISDIVGGIQDKAGKTVQQASKSNTIVKEQMVALHNTENSFKEVYEYMDSIFSIMEGMNQSVEKALESKQNTLDALENIAAISEESAAGSQEVSAGTQEQIESFETLANLSQSISNLAHELDKMISVFKICY